MQKKSSTKKSNKDQSEPIGSKKIAIMVLAICAGFYLFSPKDPAPSTARPASLPARADGAKAPKAIQQELPVPPQAPQPGYAQAKRFNAMLLKNDVARVATDASSGQLKVKLRPRTKALACKPGDFDLIKLIPLMPRDKVFTISIESLNHPEVKETHVLSVDDMESGTLLVSTLPLGNDAYGLYLCANGTPNEGCAKKDPVPQSIWEESDDGMRVKSRNKVLYFQFLLVRDNSFFIVPSAHWGQNELDTLRQNLGGFLGDDAKHLKTMTRYVSVLRPLPAIYIDKTIEIPLPYNDNQCG